MQGVEISFGVSPEARDEDAVARALGNLAAASLAVQRKERLEWRILKVTEVGGRHHFTLLVRHPQRLLDLGLHSDLKRILDELQRGTEEGLLARYKTAVDSGQPTVPLEEIKEKPDYWLDDDWALHWVGDSAGIER